MSASDFSERLFSVGSLFGLRAFQVDRLGRLIAPQKGTVFLPGENKAECRIGDIRRARLPSYVARSIASLYAVPPTSMKYDPSTGRMSVTLSDETSVADEIAPDPTKPTEHTVGALNCQCGFYAYTDGANDYYRADKGSRVAAIVEGYGICTTGSRGFRSSKARVVALIEPHRRFHQEQDDGRWERLLHNYPGVPVFASKAEAIAAHPLSEPSFPTPETDDTFWTREVAR